MTEPDKSITRYLVKFGSMWIKDDEDGKGGMALTTDVTKATRFKTSHLADKRITQLDSGRMAVYEEGLSLKPFREAQAERVKEEVKRDAATNADKAKT